jgi:hypothetical protein
MSLNSNNHIKIGSSDLNSISVKDFSIGVKGGADYGPTSTSGFYNGITPPISGYTIYVEKSSQGPSIHVPRTDEECLYYLNKYGANATNISDALTWADGQNNILVRTSEYSLSDLPGEPIPRRWSPTISQTDLDNAQGNIINPYFNNIIGYEVTDVYGNNIDNPISGPPTGVQADDYIEVSINRPRLYYYANDVKVYAVSSTVVPGTPYPPQVYNVTLCGIGTTHDVAMVYEPYNATPTIGNVYKLENYANSSQFPDMLGNGCWTINSVSTTVPNSINYTGLLGGLDYVGWQYPEPAGFVDCTTCENY